MKARGYCTGSSVYSMSALGHPCLVVGVIKSMSAIALRGLWRLCQACDSSSCPGRVLVRRRHVQHASRGMGQRMIHWLLKSLLCVRV